MQWSYHINASYPVKKKYAVSVQKWLASYLVSFTPKTHLVPFWGCWCIPFSLPAKTAAQFCGDPKLRHCSTNKGAAGLPPTRSIAKCRSYDSLDSISLYTMQNSLYKNYDKHNLAPLS